MSGISGYPAAFELTHILPSSGRATSCLTPVWPIAAPAQTSRHTQVRPWEESQGNEEGDTHTLSSWGKLLLEAPGIQAIGVTSSGVQHQGQSICCHLWSQGKPCAVCWPSLHYGLGVVWCLGLAPCEPPLTHSFHQFFFCLDYLKVFFLPVSADWDGTPSSVPHQTPELPLTPP